MNKYRGFVLVACLLGASASAEDCVRYYDTRQGTVLETCTPTKPPPEIAPGSRPLSITAPDLRFPSGVATAAVERVIDPITLQVRYNYETQTIRLRDLKLPPKGTAAYRQALAYTQVLAPAYSVLYFEASGGTDTDRAVLGYGWQLNNQLNLLLIEQGLAEYAPRQASDYDDVLGAAQDWAKAQKLGIWAVPK